MPFPIERLAASHFFAFWDRVRHTHNSLRVRHGGILGNHHNPRFGNEKSFAILFRIVTDDSVGRDVYTFVDDGPADLAMTAHVDRVHQHALFDLRPAVDVDPGRQDTVLDHA